MTLPRTLHHAPVRWVGRTLPIGWMPPAAGIAVSVILMGVLDGTVLWAAIGMLASAIVWAQIAALVAFAHTCRGALGRSAPGTTAEVLGTLRARGWKVLSDASFAGDHVDHLAVGPGGVLVVEDKWRSNPTASDLSWAAARVQRDRRRVSGLLRPAVGDAPVRAVLVSWGAGGAELPAEVDGVAVVRADRLATWLADLEGDLLAPGRVDQAWACLKRGA